MAYAAEGTGGCVWPHTCAAACVATHTRVCRVWLGRDSYSSTHTQCIPTHTPHTHTHAYIRWTQRGCCVLVLVLLLLVLCVGVCVCVCVCACSRVRACLRTRVCVCVCVDGCVLVGATPCGPRWWHQAAAPVLCAAPRAAVR